MNRNDAIYWCKSFGFDKHWPNNTKCIKPEGWRWVVSHLPYQDYTFKLVNANHEEVNKNDVLR